MVEHAFTDPELGIDQDLVRKGIEPVEGLVEYHIPTMKMRAVALSVGIGGKQT